MIQLCPSPKTSKGFPHVTKLTRSGGEQVFYRWKNLRHSNSSKVVCTVWAKGRARPGVESKLNPGQSWCLLECATLWGELHTKALSQWWNVCCVDSNVRRTVTDRAGDSQATTWALEIDGSFWAELPHRSGICSGWEILCGRGVAHDSEAISEIWDHTRTLVRDSGHGFWRMEELESLGLVSQLVGGREKANFSASWGRAVLSVSDLNDWRTLIRKFWLNTDASQKAEKLCWELWGTVCHWLCSSECKESSVRVPGHSGSWRCQSGIFKRIASAEGFRTTCWDVRCEHLASEYRHSCS